MTIIAILCNCLFSIVLVTVGFFTESELVLGVFFCVVEQDTNLEIKIIDFKILNFENLTRVCQQSTGLDGHLELTGPEYKELPPALLEQGGLVRVGQVEEGGDRLHPAHVHEEEAGRCLAHSLRRAQVVLEQILRGELQTNGNCQKYKNKITGKR